MTVDREPLRSELERQTTSTVYMVRPDHFAFNTQTAPSNTFQHNPESQTQDQVQKSALGEFETMVTTLQGHGINVIVGENTESRNTPDEVFPNNWFSTHEDGTLIYYPMLALNRRLERQSDPKFMQKLRTQGHFQPKRIKAVSYTHLTLPTNREV